MPESWSKERARWQARVGRRAQSFGRDHPRFLEAKQGLAYAKAAEHLAEVFATWPQPTDEQRTGITQILESSTVSAHSGEA